MNTKNMNASSVKASPSYAKFGKLFFVLSFFTFLTNHSFAQKDKAQEIDSIATELFKTGQIHGGILVAEGNEIIYNKAFGMSDKEAGIPNSANTVFPINSMTKSFTAVLVLQLYEEGLITLEDPITLYAHKFEHPKASQITIHDLLSHRSGLQDYFLLQLKGKMDFDISMDTMLGNIGKMELEFEPGTAFSYNNTGYVLLATLVENIRKMSFKDALEKYIFDPLEMKYTTYNSTDKLPGAVTLYDQNGEPAQTNTYFIGDAGIFSTTTDLHKFLMAINSNKLVSKKFWKLALTPHSLPKEARREFPVHFSPYGYGFGLTEWPYEKMENKLTANHGGTGFGSSSYMLRFIDNDRIVISWNNQFKPPVQPILFETMAK
ncbi:serine hydrolase domain-containing protein [Flavobacteriaceae bacterium GF1]